MRNFIIGEDLLAAIARCIGAATHQVPYGHVAALIQRLDTLPQVPDAAGENAVADAGGTKPKRSGGKGKRASEAPPAAQTDAQPAAEVREAA